MTVCIRNRQNPQFCILYTCPNDDSFTKVTRLGFSLEDLGAAKYNMLPLQIILERDIFVRNIDLNFSEKRVGGKTIKYLHLFGGLYNNRPW